MPKIFPSLNCDRKHYLLPGFAVDGVLLFHFTAVSNPPGGYFQGRMCGDSLDLLPGTVEIDTVVGPQHGRHLARGDQYRAVVEPVARFHIEVTEMP